MRETKDWDWSLVRNENGRYTYDVVQASILLDIRDELKRLNRVFECPNFLAVPHTLKEIKQNTTKPRKRRRTT